MTASLHNEECGKDVPLKHEKSPRRYIRILNLNSGKLSKEAFLVIW